jgi:DNA primase
VISLHQADIENVVASSGTALTEDQIKLMRRFTENVTVLYDGDAAGIKAAVRGIDLVLKGGLNVRIVLLPDGEDPDSFSKKMGSTELKTYLKDHTQDFISFKIGLYSRDAANDPIKKAEAIREIITSISLIPDAIKRSVYIQETSNLLRIQESVLFTELNKILIQDRQKNLEERQREEIREPAPDVEGASKDITVNPEELQEREMVRLLLNYADTELEEDVDLVTYFISEFQEREFLNESYSYIYNTFLKFKDEGKPIDSIYFLNNGPEHIKTIVAELTLRKYYASPHWGPKYHIYFADEKDNLPANVHQNVLRKKYRYVQRLIEENKEKLKDAEKRISEKEIDDLLEMQMKLKNADVEIAKELGIVSGRYY